MIKCNHSYNSEYKDGYVTVRIHESDFDSLPIGFTINHLIVPKHLEEKFKNSEYYKCIIPAIDAQREGIIEYKDFKKKYRENKLRTLID